MSTTLELRDIRKLSSDELKQFFIDNGEKAFRAKQVSEWLWAKSATSFDEMSNLSLQLREFLAKHFVINAVEVSESQHSNDGTVKSTFKLFDTHKVEGVLIPTTKRMTACISSSSALSSADIAIKRRA